MPIKHMRCYRGINAEERSLKIFSEPVTNTKETSSKMYTPFRI